MHIQLIRNATMRMTYDDRVFITDPYFAPKHSQEPLIGKSRNPIVDLPFPVKEVLANVEMAIVSHLHPDHYGKSYGGTNGRSSLYLEVDTQEKGYTDQFLLSMLHNEFSSILMRNYDFPEQEWRLVNKDGFTYSENALKVVEQDRIREQTKELLEADFLTRYAMTSMDNDFSIFAEWLLTRETELCELRKKYERINKKASLAIEFYKAIGSDVKLSECRQIASNSLE